VSRPSYGERYQVEPVPPGPEGEQLRDYLGRMSAVTRQQAIIETEAVVIAGHPEPLWRFFPHGELNHDRTVRHYRAIVRAIKN
jgi:hypothetical protein